MPVYETGAARCDSSEGGVGGWEGVGDAGAASPTNQSVYHIQEHEWPDCFISLRQHIYMEQFEISWSASVSGWDCANATLLTMKTPPPPLFFLGLCAAYRLGSACSKSGLPAIIKPLITEMDRTLLYGYFFTLPSQISNTGRKNGSGIISRR